MGYRLLTILFAALLGSCNIITSRPHKKTSEQRFDAFPTHNLPLTDSVTVYWNIYKVPFIEAKTDADAAFILGVTHAHLRLAQIGMRRF
ncbi:MAG: penicillin acylase family protein [Tenuifilaceae bacterium]|jgi:penicillin amidase|nr:penicillin acylase family protein [Tenuifilaceae bacterium]